MGLEKYEQALLWLKDLKAQINALEKEMNLIDNNYKNAITIAQQHKFMNNYIDELKDNRYPQRKNEINNVIFILNELKREVNRQITNIEFLIQQAKKA